jgi:hypothetical protein
LNLNKDTVSQNSNKSNKSEQHLSAIYGAGNPNNTSQQEVNANGSGGETFMKTDELIDLFSIDPATGRAKEDGKVLIYFVTIYSIKIT